MFQLKSMGLPFPSCRAPFSVTSKASTVTLQVAVTWGSSLEATVITVSPALTPVTTPSASTVAISGFAEVQVTVRSVAVQGCTLADRVFLEPFSSVMDWGAT